MNEVKSYEFTEEENKAVKLNPFYVFVKLIKLVGWGNKRYIAPLIVLMALNLISSLISPLLFRNLVDVGLGLGSDSSSGNLNVILSLGVVYFFLSITVVLTRIGQGYIINKIAIMTMYTLRKEMFVKLQELGLDYHDSPDKTAGKKISYLTNDVNTIQELIQSGMLVVFANIFLVFGALILMLMLSIHLTLVSFLIIPLILGIGSFIFGKARKYYRQLRKNVSEVTSTLDESITGMRIIQAFAVEYENYEEFSNATEKERTTTLKSAKLMAFVPGIVIFVMVFAIATMFFAAGILIREEVVSSGTLVAFIFYIFQFFEPLISLIGFVTLFQNSLAAGSRMIRLLREKPSITDKPTAKPISAIRGKIDYKDVDFYYEINQPVLENINVSIKSRERLALVGYTGAGKSTFIKLLSRFYDPVKGEVTLDGTNLKDLQLKSLRQNISVVPQENFLFSGTIMENIKYGKLDASDAEIIETAKKVHAHSFIMELKDGYKTIVGERGSSLSEGQRQLISFARALITDPPILILDEATSAIDPYSETLIQQALEILLKGRTSISIAHRLSTIINSDRILVLNKGKIIEEGSHRELVELNGFYKHLYEMQFKDPYKS